MEEDEEIVLISSMDLEKLEYIKSALESNNIPFAYYKEPDLEYKHYIENTKKTIKINRFDYYKAKEILEECEKYFSDNAKISEDTKEFEDIDEEYFKKQEKKSEKRKKIENILGKVLVAILLIIGILALIINVR